MVGEGVLVLGGRYPESDFLWNLASGAQISLPEKAFPDYAVSPNGKWLAFTELGDTDKWIRILTGDGQLSQSIVQESDWFQIIGWLDNERLLIDREAEPLHATVALNPFTGHQLELASNYPENYSIDAPYRRWERYAFTVSVYNSKLNKVVYIGLPDDPLHLSYQILDFKTNEMILEVDTADVANQPPILAPDGDKFIVSMPSRKLTLTNYIPDSELYEISFDGLVRKLTHLAEYFEIGVEISQYRWSPNGRFIAFWMEPNPPAGLHDPYMELAVLNMATQEVTLYCVKGDFRDGGWAPIWAPNSQQVMVKILDETGIGQIVIVDIIHEVAFRVAGDLNPYGWIVSPP